MAATSRAGGLMVGVCWVQVVPSHVQVSFKTLPLAPKPPKSSTWPVVGSVARVARLRAGGLVAGLAWVQVVPSQSHVSPRKARLPMPPKSTTRPVTVSVAMPLAARAEG